MSTRGLGPFTQQIDKRLGPQIQAVAALTMFSRAKLRIFSIGRMIILLMPPTAAVEPPRSELHIGVCVCA